MPSHPITFFALLATVPAGTLMTENPEMLVNSTGAGAISLAAFALWNIQKAIVSHSAEIKVHREREIAEWSKQDAHRERERENMTSMTSALLGRLCDTKP